jgi:hypothetical protein
MDIINIRVFTRIKKFGVEDEIMDNIDKNSYRKFRAIKLQK